MISDERTKYKHLIKQFIYYNLLQLFKCKETILYYRGSDFLLLMYQ